MSDRPDHAARAYHITNFVLATLFNGRKALTRSTAEQLLPPVEATVEAYLKKYYSQKSSASHAEEAIDVIIQELQAFKARIQRKEGPARAKRRPKRRKQ